ncbi:unnamed protein product [Protopolystoma xenopodis]|uniref:Uncharacterized protein n=1 Tax=Protopolystoma xenopodis TaxID=117903 RepID=A0A448X4K1_9PLAT|nr:unnamed protein product [Protopolystoma xenopodis]
MHIWTRYEDNWCPHDSLLHRVSEKKEGWRKQNPHFCGPKEATPQSQGLDGTSGRLGNNRLVFTRKRFSLGFGIQLQLRPRPQACRTSCEKEISPSLDEVCGAA